MPIVLNNNTKPTNIYTPKFFDTKLTGTGKKIGILNENNNPKNKKDKSSISPHMGEVKKQSFTNGSAKITTMPIYILSNESAATMQSRLLPDKQYLHPVLKSNRQDKEQQIYLRMLPHSLLLEEIEPTSSSGVIKKTLNICYRIEAWYINNDTTAFTTTPRQTCIPTMSLMEFRRNIMSTTPTVYETYTSTPLNELENLNLTYIDVDDDAFIDFINNYDLYTELCMLSEEWQTSIHKTLEEFFQNAAKHPSSHNMNQVVKTLRHLEDYNIPLDLYRNIYTSIQQLFKHDDVVKLCKENLNLLLSDTLRNLEQNKSKLTCLPTPATPIPPDPFFSKEQRNAIMTKDPLVLVQAGAGTGKSTVILARIEHMIKCGVDPKDITVLSFTNAAADHITDKNPYVHSMTIASMIHNIYSTNFPNHELSSLETIINSLDIYYPDDDFAYEFRVYLQKLLKNDANSFTRVNNFIERNYDKIVDVLNTLSQTSLELEIIICYQQIENFKEPANVMSKYLIIDEVQDNSIFEFIYALKYVDKHKESLFIVGDCSQTLYEFRASNPKALNVLEGSGVFTTYQLQTNYRSNQEILDFANITLADIEANQYANIRLRANSLQPVTAQSFQEKVNLHYEQLSKISDFKDALQGIFLNDVKPYIDDKLAKNEQVTFLAYTRQMVNQMKTLIEQMYPTLKTASLVPEKSYNSTVFSEFIKRYWSTIQFVPQRSIVSIISQEIMQRIDSLVRNSATSLPFVRNFLNKWIDENNTYITNQQLYYSQGKITQQDFLLNIRNNMLDFEIKNNAIRQSLVSMRNQQNKQNQNVNTANFLFSTIHSAKGLEFENTVIIYKTKNDLMEEQKRMYYVAFTRAMKSEFIISYDTVMSPKIVADYERIVDNLTQKQTAAQTNNAVVVDDDVTVVNLASADEVKEELAATCEQVQQNLTDDTQSDA